ncbi:MAG: hypothetical protein ACTSWQ_11330, partial [Candidatus Thorarchaeota archaeon]
KELHNNRDETYSILAKAEEERKLNIAVQEALSEAVNSHTDATGEPPSDKKIKSMESGIREEYSQYPAYQVTDDHVPHGTLSKSHLEAIAALPTEDMKVEMAVEIVEYGYSVNRTQEQVSRRKKNYETEQFFKNSVEQAHMKVCPKCGSRPRNANKDGDMVTLSCSSYSCYERWPITQTREEWDKLNKKEIQKAEKKAKKEKEAKKPDYIRHTLTEEEIDKLLSAYVAKLLNELQSVSRCRLYGTRKDGKQISIDFDPTGIHGISIDIGKGEPNFSYIPSPDISFGFTYEKKSYNSAKLAHLKTLIRGRRMPLTDENLDLITGFIENGVKTGDDPPKWIPKNTGGDN